MNLKISKLVFALIFPAILQTGLLTVQAQSRNTSGRAKAVRKTPRTTTASQSPETATKPIQSPVSVPVSIVNVAEADFLSGEASVTVNPKQPTVIRLGLAQNAVSIIEFPASDGIYYIHEGNPKLASVFQSPTKETDRSITVYPGEAFVPSRDGSNAAAISLQMRSGLILVLEFVPVADLRKNAHRCVVVYDRDAVIAARKTAGLAYNLGGDNPLASPLTSRASSKLVATTPFPEKESRSESKTLEEDPVQTASFILNRAGSKNIKPSTRKLSDSEISAAANKKLAEALRDPKKYLPSWTKAQAGLEMGVSRINELDAETRLIVAALRNVTASNLRLIAGSPELQIQTTDSNANSIQTIPLAVQYNESTTLEGLIQPGSTVYYALVYKAPILGTNQSVRILAAHREAADAPVAASLTDPKPKE